MASPSRGHAKVFNESLSPAIQYSLHWWKKLLSGLTLATPRVVPFGLPQVVSFGDGEGTAQIAATLCRFIGLDYSEQNPKTGKPIARLFEK